MTTPVEPGSSGAAAKAAKRLPSAASRTRSSWETEAPEMAGIGGTESVSKHTAGGSYGRAAYEAAMGGEQSHREEMNAAIRAQRERQRKAAPPPGAEPARNRSSLARLVARLRGK